MAAIKGAPVRAFEGRQTAGYSDKWIDCRAANALTVQVEVSGTGASATVAVEGAPLPGGQSLPLDDPQASQSLVTSNRAFDCAVGTAFARLRLTNVLGTFVGSEGFTVTATPFVSPGGGRLSVTMG